MATKNWIGYRVLIIKPTAEGIMKVETVERFRVDSHPEKGYTNDRYDCAEEAQKKADFVICSLAEGEYKTVCDDERYEREFKDKETAWRREQAKEQMGEWIADAIKQKDFTAAAQLLERAEACGYKLTLAYCGQEADSLRQ